MKDPFLPAINEDDLCGSHQIREESKRSGMKTDTVIAFFERRAPA
jgi:hypothetical protein